MPLMEIIRRANKIKNPPALTRETGIYTETTIDPVTGKTVVHTGTTWCHTAAYYKLRSSYTSMIKQDKTDPAEEIHESDSMSATLRRASVDLSKLTAKEREFVLKLLQG